MLWEPLGYLRTELPAKLEADRQRLAETALRELHAEGLIYFFRVTDMEVNEAAIDPQMRLSPEDAEAVISGTDWRTLPVGHDGHAIWLGPTETGETVAALSRSEASNDSST